MTDEVMQVATALADALEAENAALRAMDVPRAVAGLPEKASLTQRLQHAAKRHADMPAAEREAACVCAARLDRLAEENRRLLERAMVVQGQLIATLARAVRHPPVGYGHAARGGGAKLGIGPITLSARA